MIVLGGILIAGITGEDAAQWVAGKPKTPEEIAADLLNAWIKENKPESTFVVTPEFLKEFWEFVKLKNATQTDAT